VEPVKTSPRSNTGHSIVQVPTPAERIATISLSVPIREKPINIPAKVARGIVKLRIPGNMVTAIPATTEKGRSV